MSDTQGWLLFTGILWLFFFYIFWLLHSRWGQCGEFAREWRTYAHDARDHLQLLEQRLKIGNGLTDEQKSIVTLLLQQDFQTIERANKYASKWEERVPKFLRKRYV